MGRNAGAQFEAATPDTLQLSGGELIPHTPGLHDDLGWGKRLAEVARWLGLCQGNSPTELREVGIVVPGLARRSMRCRAASLARRGAMTTSLASDLPQEAVGFLLLVCCFAAALFTYHPGRRPDLGHQNHADEAKAQPSQESGQGVALLKTDVLADAHARDPDDRKQGKKNSPHRGGLSVREMPAPATLGRAHMRHTVGKAVCPNCGQQAQRSGGGLKSRTRPDKTNPLHGGLHQPGRPAPDLHLHDIAERDVGTE